MTFNPDDIQGNILRGYRYERVRYFILEVDDRAAARGFLAASAGGNSADVPAITSGAKWPEKRKPPVCFNIGLTYDGLRALGMPPEHLATFPIEFIDGMTKRALKLGDIGASAPHKWPGPFNEPARVNIVATIYANDEQLLDHVQDQVARAFKLIGTRDGRALPESKVFFGYKDNISQPRFKHVDDPEQTKVNEPIDPLGTILLGHPTRFEGLRFSVPTPEELGLNGTFNAFRVLAQDASGFEDYLDLAADELLKDPNVDQLLVSGEGQSIVKGLDRHGTLREIVAAQMCGRWRDGVPYASSPNPQYSQVSLTNFDYDRTSQCPAGAHARRVNPRGGPIVQRIANYTRRLVRRGMSYGPDFDPRNRDDCERGLLGNFICASLGAQFEAVMCDWLNLGLQDPDITGSNDPLIGANSPETSWFDLTLRNGGTIRIRGIPRFVTARGGAYLFLPSLPAIKYLSRLTS
jgi:deferrochelatase/peroxidase EfeB